MTIVKEILRHMPGIAKPQATFLTFLLATILARRGRCNFRNLSRYGTYCERTIARQFRHEFDWPRFNQQVIGKATQPSHSLIAAHDASFIPKSGKRTYGLDHFFNSCAGRAERGLEISTLAVVNATDNAAYTLAVAQTLPGEELLREEKEQTRIDFYVQQLHEQRHLLPARVNYLAADGFYAKRKYVDGVRPCHLHLITKLRCDADLRFLYTGKREKRRGRPRLYDGKVDFQDLSRFQYLGTVDEADHLHLYTAVLYHITLKRRLRVVVVVDCRDPNKLRYAGLASTETLLAGKELYRFYRARFQSEFIFRDAKQFTGLVVCQARDGQALHFHFNAALSTLNVARAEAVLAHRGSEALVLSMASRKQVAFNELFVRVISEELALNLTAIINHPAYDNLRTYGAIAA
jgi:DDE superfamily endonuclease